MQGVATLVPPHPAAADETGSQAPAHGYTAPIPPRPPGSVDEQPSFSCNPTDPSPSIGGSASAAGFSRPDNGREDWEEARRVEQEIGLSPQSEEEPGRAPYQPWRITKLSAEVLCPQHNPVRPIELPDAIYFLTCFIFDEGTSGSQEGRETGETSLRPACPSTNVTN